MSIDQAVDLIFPLLFGIGGIYMLLHSRFTLKKRNVELAKSWRAQPKDEDLIDAKVEDWGPL